MDILRGILGGILRGILGVSGGYLWGCLAHHLALLPFLNSHAVDIGCRLKVLQMSLKIVNTWCG